MDARRNKAAALVAVVSTMLIAGALSFEAAGYAACEMCMWQRWAHVEAAGLATLALLLRRAPGGAAPLALAAAICGLIASGATGIFHAGVEWKLWEGLTTCSAKLSSGSGDVLMDIVRAPLVRCDEAAWRLMGISMAGYNALISLGTAAAAVVMMTGSASDGNRKRRGKRACT